MYCTEIRHRSPHIVSLFGVTDNKIFNPCKPQLTHDFHGVEALNSRRKLPGTSTSIDECDSERDGCAHAVMKTWLVNQNDKK